MASSNSVHSLLLRRSCCASADCDVGWHYLVFLDGCSLFWVYLFYSLVTASKLAVGKSSLGILCFCQRKRLLFALKFERYISQNVEFVSFITERSR